MIVTFGFLILLFPCSAIAHSPRKTKAPSPTSKSAGDTPNAKSPTIPPHFLAGSRAHERLLKYPVTSGNSIADDVNKTLLDSTIISELGLYSLLKEFIAEQKVLNERSLGKVTERLDKQIELHSQLIVTLLKAYDSKIEPLDRSDSTECETYSDCKKILHKYVHFKSKESMKELPVPSSEDPAIVNLRIDLQQIVDINEAEEFIKVRLYVTQWFSYPSLGWVPRDFRGVSRVELSSHDETWMPDIYPFNGFDSRNEDYYLRPLPTISSEQVDANEYREHKHGKQGTRKDEREKIKLITILTYSYPRIMTFSCSFDTFYFPFDYQMCFIVFHSWKHTMYDLFMYPQVGENSTQENDEWFFLDVTVSAVLLGPEEFDINHRGNIKSMYEMAILLKRKPLYYIVNILVPSVIITQVAFFGFFCPSSSDGDRTEKVNLGMGTLLAMSVLLLTISGMTPVDSTYIPLTGIFFLVNMALITLGIIMTTVIMTIHQRGKRKKRVPRRIQKILFFQVAPRIGLKIPTIIKRSWHAESDNVQSFGEDSSSRTEEIILLDAIPEVNKLTQQINSMFNKRRRELAEVEYIFLAKILDVIMLLSFSAMLYIATAAFIAIGLNQPIPTREEWINQVYKNSWTLKLDMEQMQKDFMATFDENNDNHYGEAELCHTWESRVTGLRLKNFVAKAMFCDRNGDNRTRSFTLVSLSCGLLLLFSPISAQDFCPSSDCPPKPAMSTTERTFIAIKPDGVHRNLVGDIISRFEQRGFKLVAMKMVQASEDHLKVHYQDLAEEPFFAGLVKYMASGPIVALGRT